MKKKPTLEKIFKNMPSTARPTFARMDSTKTFMITGEPIPDKIVYILGVTEKGWGFGEISFTTDKKGRTFINTERGGPDSVIHFLSVLLDNAIYDTDTDLKKHRLYNKVTGSSCGPSCALCPGTDPIEHKKMVEMVGKSRCGSPCKVCDK